MRATPHNTASPLGAPLGPGLPANTPGTVPADPLTGQPGTVPGPDAPGQPLPLPHERDQAATGAVTGDGGPGPVDPVIRQAHRDLQQGQVDTDLRGTPGLDADRREQLVPGEAGRVRPAQLGGGAVPGSVEPDEPGGIDPAETEDGAAPPHPQPALG